MKELLNHIMEQRYENISDIPKVIPSLREKFNIKNRDNGNDGTEELIDSVIFWEKHTEIYQSLEEFLKERFIVE